MIRIMLKLLKICWLVLWLGLSLGTAAAKDLVIEHALLEDQTGRLDLAQVRSLDFSATAPVTFAGFSRSAFWFRLTADVPAGQQPLALSISPTLLDSVTVFLPASPALPHGAELRLDHRKAQGKTALDLSAGLQTIYLRVESTGALLFRAQLMTMAEAAEKDFRNQLKLGAVLTVYALLSLVMLSMLLLRYAHFQLFVVIHLGACLLHYLTLFDFLGHFVPWAWAQQREAVQLLGIVNFLTFGLLMQALLGWFHMPRAKRGLQVALAGFSLLIPLFLWTDRQLILQISSYLGSSATLLAMGTLLFLLIKFLRRKKWSPWVQVAIGTVVGLFVLSVVRAMLQVTGLVQASDFLLESTALRGIFFPAALIGFIWLRDQDKDRQLVEVQIEKAVSDEMARAQVQRLENQSQFMAMLMHELKTPLYTIEIAATSLGRGMEADHPDITRLNNINRSVDDLNFIIDRCVQADQLEQSDVPPAKTSLNLQTLLAEIGQIQGHERIALTGITEAMVFTDYPYARIILINLLTNALKYSPPDSPVQLDLQAQQVNGRHTLNFRVSNAVGAAGKPDPLKVFSRYYRAEGAKKVVGAGLGLWLANAIAIKLGTQLRCSTEEALVHFDFSLELS
jgi:signal transduction histidine kinase